jgi:hypothetical protein
MPKQAKDKITIIALNDAAESLDKKKMEDDTEKADKMVEEDYCCPKCGYCGSEMDFEKD